jgi:iron complex outermembrane recepter protein
MELENEFSSRLLVIAAGRYEYYSDFGGNMAGKFAARYKISKKFLLRGSVNNGFRAPSLQQRYQTSLSEIWTGPLRINSFRGTFPNSHKVVGALNIPSLTAEKSININGGITSSLSKNIHISIDAYWIQIKNRIVLSGSFERRQGNKLDSILKIYPELNNITLVSFFTNAINTRTKGIDIIIDGNWNNKKESFGLSLAANFNSTQLYGKIKTSDKLETIAQSATTLFNNEDKARLEKGQPGSKIILSINYKTGNIKLNIRNTRFGKTMIAPLTTDPEYFSSKILTDISLAYSISSWATITIGTNNIANIYPDRLKHYDNTGQGSWIYSPEASPFGFNGGYYFATMTFNFRH